MLVVSSDSSILFANPAATEIFGFEDEHLPSAHFEHSLALEGVKELNLTRPDGKCVHLESRVSKILWNDTQAFLVTMRDITEHKRLEAQLRQAQKMDAVGRLAGGVAHDFNNMLGVIIGRAELALRKLDPANPLFAALQEIQKAAGRSADLTRQLLAFARKQTVSPKILNLNETVEGMLKMLRRLIGEDIDLTWLPKKEGCQVKMDPSQIDQILANLCVNARDAIAGVGKIIIETDITTFDEAYCDNHIGAVPGNYALLAVSDDGCGMSKETLDRMFEPFFTTKELGKGTGLGLATVYGIVKQNNGFIDVRSKIGHGTSFNIYLPLYLEETEQMPETTPPESIAEGRETILLVEDEPVNLTITKEMLEVFGYRVFAASTPDDAIHIANERSGNIQLLITDVVMPKMNGLDLAKKLLALYPGMKCLFMSGYTSSVLASNGVMSEGLNYIQKPFLMQDFSSKVREVLDLK